jgi:hypothetical protein
MTNTAQEDITPTSKGQEEYLTFLIGLLITLDIFPDAKTAGLFLMFDMSKNVTKQGQLIISKGPDDKEVVSFKQELKGGLLNRDFIAFSAYRTMLQVNSNIIHFLSIG